MGLKHNPGFLLKLAQEFRNDNHVRVVILSEGIGANWLQNKKMEYNLQNLMIFNYQAYDQIPFVLASSDVLVAILTPEAGKFSVPSKVLTYMCAKRPILLAVPEDNLISNIVRENKMGFVVDPGDEKGFIDKAIHLYEDEEIRKQFGANARIYAENNFQVRNIADKFEEVIEGK
jgi:glycosyltransferase involved in cell wall biosynthesis